MRMRSYLSGDRASVRGPRAIASRERTYSFRRVGRLLRLDLLQIPTVIPGYGERASTSIRMLGRRAIRDMTSAPFMLQCVLAPIEKIESKGA
jgi:hypothetical protein